MNDRSIPQARRGAPVPEGQPELEKGGDHAWRGPPHPGRSHELAMSGAGRKPADQLGLQRLPFAPVILRGAHIAVHHFPHCPATRNCHAAAACSMGRSTLRVANLTSSSPSIAAIRSASAFFMARSNSSVLERLEPMSTMPPMARAKATTPRGRIIDQAKNEARRAPAADHDEAGRRA